MYVEAAIERGDAIVDFPERAIRLSLKEPSPVGSADTWAAYYDEPNEAHLFYSPHVALDAGEGHKRFFEIAHGLMERMVTSLDGRPPLTVVDILNKGIVFDQRPTLPPDLT